MANCLQNKAATSHYCSLFVCTVYAGFWSTAVRDVAVQTNLGGSVALECDFLVFNRVPRADWYANRTTTKVEEDLVNNNVLYLEGGRYLYIRALTAEQRKTRYNCQVANFINISPLVPGYISNTTYTLDTDLESVGITVYKRLGTKIGKVGEQLQFVYAATRRNADGDFEDFGVLCPSNNFVTISIGNNFVLTVTLNPAAENETEVTFTCVLAGADLQNMPITGTIIVDSEYTVLCSLVGRFGS